MTALEKLLVTALFASACANAGDASTEMETGSSSTTSGDGSLATTAPTSMGTSGADPETSASATTGTASADTTGDAGDASSEGGSDTGDTGEEPDPHFECEPASCDHTIVATGGYQTVDGAGLGIAAGDRVCVQAGQFFNLVFDGIVGTADAPVEIVNCGGLVEVGGTDGQRGIAFWGSSHFRLLGIGSLEHTHGFQVLGTPPGEQAIAATALSSDFEIAWVEVASAGFAGIMAKTDPRCDGTANLGNFVMRNVELHHCNIHDVGGEGFYVGNSFAGGYDDNPGCPGVVLYPHEVVDVRIHDNLIERSGAEAIQVGVGVEGVEVYGNVVRGFGQDPFANYQNNGLQIGAGSGGRWHHNWVEDGPGSGFIVLGDREVLVHDNVIVGAGTGMYLHQDAADDALLLISNNTFVSPESYGIHTFNTIADIQVHNNLFVVADADQAFYQQAQGQWTEDHNLVFTDTIAPRFADVDAGDYDLLADSPARDVGVDASAWGVLADHLQRPRDDGAYDVDAFEYGR